jgi:hypothetical protein
MQYEGFRFDGGAEEQLQSGDIDADDALGILSIDDHCPAAQQAGDFMDLDLDECISWAGDLNHSLITHSEWDPGPHDPFLPAHNPAGLGVETGFPPDHLFAEDEWLAPKIVEDCASSDRTERYGIGAGGALIPPVNQTHDSELGVGSNESAHLVIGMDDERLRSQLSLLSSGSCGDEIAFKNCDASKAIVLHTLAMEFGLNYSYDAQNRGVSVARVTTGTEAPEREKYIYSVPPAKAEPVTRNGPRNKPGLPEQSCLSSFTTPPSSSRENHMQKGPSSREPTASEEHGVAEHYLPSVLVDSYDSSSRVSDKTVHQTEGSKFGTGTASDGQQLSRQPSRSRRISDSISRHVSTWTTSIAKGGRRGPLSESSRRDMKALERSGGACWRCKVLRRKVSRFHNYFPYRVYMDTKLTDQKV